MSLRFGFLLLAAGSAACFSDPPAPQRIPSESGTSSGGPEDPTGSTGEEPPPATTSGSSSTGGPVGGCQDAFDAQSCAAASDPTFEACSWYPTMSHDVSSCEPWATGGGACVIEQGLDGCFAPEPTCPDGASWYYRVTDGSVELVDATNLCYGLGEFTPCPAFSGKGSGSTDSDAGTLSGSSSSGGAAESGASASSFGESSGGETGGGETGGGSSLPEEIEAVCACACDE